MLHSFMAGVEAAGEVCLFAGQLPRPADNWKRKQKTNFLKTYPLLTPKTLQASWNSIISIQWEPWFESPLNTYLRESNKKSFYVI